VQRKLAAILSADAQGFSRLMGADETETVRTLTSCRNVISRTIEMGGGRVVDMPGDNVLAEFASAVDAVKAAVEMQAQLAECNREVPEERRMVFRIGVNLGDVLVEDQRVYGDGVNVAARVEKMAEPGGICVSGKVYEEVCRKLDFGFEDLGEHELHNIAGKIRVYRVRKNSVAATKVATASAGSAKPAIIVLPFTNMSGDSEQEFFADGLTEDLLTELSRFRELTVISRNTSFKFKGQAVEIKKVARDLGVQYVVEGSVRRAGNRVRVSVQLIEGEADRHIWAERYDRQLEDIFALQDEITRAIVATLPGRMEAATRERVARKPTENMAAYECVIAAKLLHHRSSRKDNAEAQRLINRAVELDPKYAHARAWRACILGQTYANKWCEDMEATLGEVKKELDQALALDDNDSDVHRILAAVNLVRHDFSQAVYHQQRALDLNPNDDLIVVQQGEILTWTGQAEEGIEWIRRAMRLNPFHPERFWSHLGRAYFVSRRYPEAVEALARLSAPDHLHHALFAACYIKMGDAQRSRSHLEEALKREPGLSAEKVLATQHYARESEVAHHRDCLIAAGLPA
jgi:adenylate cyclase